ERAVEEPLREAEREGRPLRQALRPLADGGLELRRRHDLVDEAEALRILRREIVAEEDELLRLVESDLPREQEPPAGVERDAAADEDLDEACVVRGDDEVAGVDEVRAEPGRDAVHARDDRLLELPERADDPLARAHRV